MLAKVSVLFHGGRHFFLLLLLLPLFLGQERREATDSIFAVVFLITNTSMSSSDGERSVRVSFAVPRLMIILRALVVK